MVSIWRTGILTTIALASAIGGGLSIPQPVTAQKTICVPDGVALMPGALADSNDIRVLLPWDEVEGVWHGKWTPVRGSPGQYAARFATAQGTASEPAMLRIAITGNTVSVVRTQPMGTCTYTGTLNADGWRANGTYSCSWGGGRLPWAAAIGPGHQVAGSTCDDARLRAPWRETEGVWAGDWQPKGGGLYQGRWNTPGEGARAMLEMRINGNTVTVLRSAGEGDCRYNGTFGPNGWTVSGTYTCDWNPPRTRLRWSAVIGDGSPPPPGDLAQPIQP